MKIDEQESCEYRFALICIGFDRFYRFLLFDFTFSEKRKKRKGIQRNFLIVGAHFPLT